MGEALLHDKQMLGEKVHCREPLAQLVHDILFCLEHGNCIIARRHSRKHWSG